MFHYQENRFVSKDERKSKKLPILVVKQARLSDPNENRLLLMSHAGFFHYGTIIGIASKLAQVWNKRRIHKLYQKFSFFGNSEGRCQRHQREKICCSANHNHLSTMRSAPLGVSKHQSHKRERSLKLLLRPLHPHESDKTGRA